MDKEGATRQQKMGGGVALFGRRSMLSREGMAEDKENSFWYPYWTWLGVTSELHRFGGGGKRGCTVVHF